ncbi:MAG: golvesin C-terminal-like domain-containing protein [Dehalococcoidia bacterium]
MRKRLIVAVAAAVVCSIALLAGRADAAVYIGYAPPLTDAGNIPWTSQDSGWLSTKGADADAWDIANRAATSTSQSAQAIHDFLRSGGIVYLLIPGYNPLGNSQSRSDWEVPLADYLNMSNNSHVLIMELDYWRTNIIYGWAFSDGVSKAESFAAKAKSAGAGQVIIFAHSLGADVTGQVTQDSANVSRGYGFGIPCFSSWAPKNDGYVNYQGFHRVNGGKYIEFSRTSDPASQDGCVVSLLGNWSSNSGSVPGHDYMELVYDNDYHRYVNSNGSCPCPSTNFMAKLYGFANSTSNEDTTSGSTYDWNKTAADYRTMKAVDDNNATLSGTYTVLSGDGYDNAVRRAYGNGSKATVSATWRAALAGGTKYEARVFVPAITGTSTVTYKICYSGGCTTRQVNQASYSDVWVSLGTYTFSGTSSDYVYMNNATGGTSSIGVDAVEFIPKSQ